MKISVVTPIYNEAENIPELVRQVGAVLNSMGPMNTASSGHELIAVDDGSTDGSFKLLKDLATRNPFLKVIRLQRNSGQAAAFDAGIQNAGGEVIVTMDADLQNDPADIPKLLAKLSEGYDSVSGWRKNRQDGFILRRLPSRIANWIIARVTESEIHDLGCSLKAYRAEIIKELRLYGEMHRYICPLLSNMGAQIAEIEVNHRPRVAGVSKYGIGRVFKVLLDMIYVWFNKSYQTKPMYVFGGAGALLLALSVLLAGLAGYEKVFNGVFVHRNPVFLLGMVSFLAAVQMFGIGILAELLIRTYFESKGTSSYLIRERIGF